MPRAAACTWSATAWEASSRGRWPRSGPIRSRRSPPWDPRSAGSPFRGSVAHSKVLRASDAIRNHILREHAGHILPGCYTEACTCEFVSSLKAEFPDDVAQTAIYTRSDGIVDWRYCVTGDPEIDCEVTGTHVGLVFNPAVYRVLAGRLARTI